MITELLFLNEDVTTKTEADGQPSFNFTGTELEIAIRYEDGEAELAYDPGEGDDDSLAHFAGSAAGVGFLLSNPTNHSDT